MFDLGYLWLFLKHDILTVYEIYRNNSLIKNYRYVYVRYIRF